ncbi:unnamed protein product [Peronospora belbahrii]|uniref:Uncharacterized protein n=1 Tax=Peronospora belbahrii TaxID=622444 RepID=A0AAU9KV54_9STRA|nr:unnamed protein product [Peronospora belbahrii]
MPSPMAMCDFLAIRTVPRGGFSFHKVFEEEESGEEKQDEILQEEQDNRMEAVNRRTMRRRESPTFSRRRPVRFVLEDADKAGYLGVSLKPNEAATRFETLIGARRRQRASTLQMYVSAAPALDRVPLSAAAAPATRVKNVLEHSASNESGTAASEELLRPQDKNKVMEEDEERRELEQSGVSSPPRQQVGRDALEEDEGRKRPATNEPLTDFQAFCASFAAGGSAAAHRAMAKRKQYGAVNKQADSSATALHQIFDRLKHPRTVGQEMKQPNGDDTAVTPRSANKRSHYEAFGFDETEMTDNAVATRQVLQKSKNEQVSGMTNNQEEPEKKTPQIARRISFDNEVDALVDTPSKGVSGRLSNRKRKRTQAFGMSDEDDKDTEWRDSLAFRPHRFRQAD